MNKLIYPIGGYAPGMYIQKCTNCKETFMGDKYARQCETCAINSVNEISRSALLELRQLKNALNKIKFSNDVINKILSDETTK